MDRRSIVTKDRLTVWGPDGSEKIVGAAEQPRQPAPRRPSILNPAFSNFATGFVIEKIQGKDIKS
jgi:hypothetical protein